MCRTYGTRAFCRDFSRALRTGLTCAAPPALDAGCDSGYLGLQEFQGFSTEDTEKSLRTRMLWVRGFRRTGRAGKKLRRIGANIGVNPA